MVYPNPTLLSTTCVRQQSIFSQRVLSLHCLPHPLNVGSDPDLSVTYFWLFPLVSPPKFTSCMVQFCLPFQLSRSGITEHVSFGSCFIDSASQMLSTAFVRSEGRVGTHSFSITDSGDPVKLQILGY